MIKNDVLKGYESYWNGWEWEWFVTLNLKNNEYSQSLKYFTISLCITENIQVAYDGVLVNGPQPHLHILMIGHNRFGKSLFDVTPHIWERRWLAVTHQEAKIIPVYDNAGVISYIVWQNMARYRHESLVAYNRKMLESNMTDYQKKNIGKKATENEPDISLDEHNNA